jgi:arylsulfatase
VNTHNAGLRGRKTEYYDGGHRVPCWVRWPAEKLGQPRDVAAPTQVQDLLPTLLELCGVPAPAGARFDGTSLAGLLRGARTDLPDRMLVVQYSRDKLAKWDSCVIWGKWRLVKGEELYDAEADRGQQTDLAAKQPDVVKRMRDHYEKWWAEIEPKVNEYEPCAFLGSEKQPEVALTSADWEGIYADNTGHVRAAVGGPTGGHWHVFVEKPGEYEVALRRWPRETKVALGAKYDDPAGGKKAESKAFPVAGAKVRAAGVAESAKAAPTDQEVTVRMKLPAGKTTLKAWFHDEKGTDLCGAFYAYVRRVE